MNIPELKIELDTKESKNYWMVEKLAYKVVVTITGCSTMNGAIDPKMLK